MLDARLEVGAPPVFSQEELDRGSLAEMTHSEFKDFPPCSHTDNTPENNGVPWEIQMKYRMMLAETGGF